MPGIATSSTITSGGERSAAASAAPPSAATVTAKPSADERALEHAPQRRIVVDDQDALTRGRAQPPATSRRRNTR